MSWSKILEMKPYQITKAMRYYEKLNKEVDTENNHEIKGGN